MQRHCEHCMHKMHRSYKDTIQRRDGRLLMLQLELAVIVAGEGDSCAKKKESVAAELQGRGTM